MRTRSGYGLAEVLQVTYDDKLVVQGPAIGVHKGAERVGYRNASGSECAFSLWSATHAWSRDGPVDSASASVRAVS